ncbi:mitotic spindle assembly checkpoint protein 1 [Tieghemostelium lacteum]|uniref:Mitotic spindle assembly checkpoint protein 1 n=1 Tax=Tieghemostelium lacteum TaxID=361077 RepID=A0A151ZHG1_TIELA|nr:mitotic spindle assembly checkpoint protein 1 [Tieghemostelium lacteum]|eukprot:KYQ93412.1 mitotic spindle assembly checkpoint protein 1 [Tieghemostelium lacteum]
MNSSQFNNSFMMNSVYNNSLSVSTIQKDIEKYLDADETGDHTTTLLFEAHDTLQKQQELIDQLKGQLKNEGKIENDFRTQSLILTDKDSELKEFKNKCYDLERQIKFYQTKAAEAMLKVEDEKKSSERKIESKNKELDDLQSKIRYLSTSDTSNKKRAEELELKISEVERNYQLKVKSLEKEKLQFRSENVDLKHKSNQSQDQWFQESNKDSQIQLLYSQKLEYEQQLNEQKQRLDSVVTALADSEKHYELLKLSVSTGTLENDLKKLRQQLVDSENIRKSLTKEVTYCQEQNEKLQKEIGNYRQQAQSIGNSEFIKQQNEMLKDKLSRFEETLTKYNTLQVEFNQLKQQQKQYQINENNNYSNNLGITVDELKIKLSQVEIDNQVLLGKLGEMTSNLRVLENRNKELQESLDQDKDSTNVKNSKISELTDKIKRLEKNNYLLKAERDGMKRILDAFDVEENISLKNSNGEDGEIQGQSSNSKMRLERINELERALNEKNLLLEQYESKLSKGTSTQNLNPMDVDEIDYREEYPKLNKEIERLMEEIAILESRLGRGEYDQSKFKVLHMTSNPSNIGMEESSNNNNASSPSGADKNLLEENHRLQIQINDFEKKMERLKSVFRQKINEFREAVYSLLGYKIDVDTQNRYKLISMYSEKESDYLMFQYSLVNGTSSVNGNQQPKQNGKVGNMELLETDFTKSLDKEMRAYLFTCKSIPSFLSQITLELFSRQTFHP